jgi:hypothetical protein
MIYARNSLGAYVRNDMGMVSGDSTIRHVMDAHPLVHKEKQREEEDIEFLSTMLDSPWFEDVFSLLQRRAEAQGGLFDKI